MGNSAADTFVAAGGADILVGNGGADSIDAGGGTDAIRFADAVALNAAATVIGGAGNDTISITTAGVAVADSDVNLVDTVEVLAFTANGNNSATLETEALAAGIVSVFGGTGDDTFDASNAAYNATGVYFDASSGANSLVGGGFNDSLIGGSGVDTFVAGGGNDTIFGNGGADSILAGAGTDRIVFATAAALDAVATLEGDAGNDTIAITTGGETVLDTYFQTDVVTVEALHFAGNGNNSATFATHANTAGIASLFGGTGNDSLTVDSTIYTAPAFVGSTGTDVLSLSDDAATLTSTFFAGLSGVESFRTANGANDITFGLDASTAGLQTITGGTGADDLDASAMNTAVTLMGGTGADTLTGGSAGNRLQGWGGTSTANVSNDTLTGGAGTDVFVLGDATGNAYGFDSNPAVNYRALITGFAMGTDRFQLWDADQTGSVTVAADGTIANQMNISVGVLQVYRFNYDNAADTGTLYVAGTTKVVAELTGFTGSGASLTNSHFTIV